MQAKLKVAPLQANEAANIRRKVAAFDVEQHSFREKFRSQGPYFYDTRRPYDMLDEVNKRRIDIYLNWNYIVLLV
jgi:dynein heavy chain